MRITLGIPYSGCEYTSDIPCTSEAEVIAIACGVLLGGGEPFVFMQDSGWLNCLNNFASLCEPYDLKINNGYIKEVSEPEHHKYSNTLFKHLRGRL